MKCSTCGIELPPSSQKCSHCGTVVSEAFNYNNMENELLNTVLEEENMIGFTQDTESEQLEMEEEEIEVEKHWGQLAVSLLAGAVIFAGIILACRLFQMNMYIRKRRLNTRTVCR